MNEVTRPIEVITSEIKFYAQQAGMSVIEIGKRLHEAKICLPHGEWGNWLKNEVNFSERAAQNFMRIAREYQNPQLLADMGNSTTKALLLLTLPAEEREEFVAEPHIIDGEAKTVAEMTTKEMEELTRELAAERAEKEKLQTQLDLFRTEAEKEKDDAVAEAVDETVNKVMFEAEQELDRVRQQLAEEKKLAEDNEKEALQKVKLLEKELDEMRMQKEQVSIPDESELERVRAEAEKKVTDAMKLKLEQAKSDVNKYKAQAKEAEDAIEAHEQAQKEAEEAALQAKAELARIRAETERKAKLNASSVVAVFRVHFEAVQTEMDKMKECLEQTTPEERERLCMALKNLYSKALNDLTPNGGKE